MNNQINFARQAKGSKQTVFLGIIGIGAVLKSKLALLSRRLKSNWMNIYPNMDSPMVKYLRNVIYRSIYAYTTDLP